MFLNPFSRAPLALASVILGGALLVSGCGGGGGGGVSTPTPTSGPTSTPVPASSVFADEFNGRSLDTSKWYVLDSSQTLQRTEFGNQPDFSSQDADGTRFMRLRMDSFSPDDPTHTQFYGTEVVAKSKISRGSGVVFEARMRFNQPDQQGIVGAFFLFGQKGNYGDTTMPLSFDEIDQEVLTKAFFDPKPYTWTNIYNDFRVPQPGLPSGDSYFDLTKQNGLARPFTSGYSKGGWNVYRIVWKPGEVQWFINGNPIDPKDTTGRVPDDDLGVRFNLWAAKDWAAAYSDTLKPAATAAEKQTFSLDVDWVHVRTLDATGDDARALSASRLVPLTPNEITRGLPGASYRSSARR